MCFKHLFDVAHESCRGSTDESRLVPSGVVSFCKLICAEQFQSKTAASDTSLSTVSFARLRTVAPVLEPSRYTIQHCLPSTNGPRAITRNQGSRRDALDHLSLPCRSLSSDRTPFPPPAHRQLYVAISLYFEPARFSSRVFRQN